MNRTNLEWSLRPLRSLLLCALGLLLIFSCSTKASPQVGSETHFLRYCGEGCEAGTECLCGVCTKVCAATADCANLGGVASCAPLGPRVAEQRCGAAEAGSVCDAPCLGDADCSKLSPERICADGYCREPGPAFKPEPAACMPPKLGTADLLILGDVLIELTSFAADFEQAAVSAGNLSAGEHYRNLAAGGSSLLATGALSIDNEYTSARASGAARVILMDGGATDVLTGQCAGMLTPDCPAAHAAVSGAEQLFARFARDGVEHVVYFFYGDPVGNPTLKDGLDLMRPLLRNACGRSPVPCHWLDLRPTFTGHPEYVAAEGLVFTDAGAAVAAAATYAFMQKQCVVN